MGGLSCCLAISTLLGASVSLVVNSSGLLCDAEWAFDYPQGPAGCSAAAFGADALKGAALTTRD